MAKKLDSIVELAAQKTREISANSGNYMAFLTTAAHNFKYNFRDQLLIYAQKPDATACAQIDFWNKHGRYVNQGTRGIALLVDTDRGYKLRYVFDMSDTNSRQGRTIPIWKMEPRYEDAVIEALENSYGEFPDRSGLAACLLETAKVIVEDNFSDYLTELRGVKEGSLLEELDDLSTETWFRGLVESSVAFIMLTRCGIDPMDYFSGEDFAHVYDFDTPETLSILGGAVSDIAEMPLREIASTVLSLYRAEQRENRTFAQTPNRPYHDSRTKQERSIEHGTDISNGGRLPSAQSGSAGGPEGRKIWDAAAQLPSDPQERLLHGDAPQRQAERPSGEDRPAGHGDGGAADGADGAGAGRDGGAESQRSDEVGGPDEQHPGSGGGNGADGASLYGRVSDPLIAGEAPPQAPVDGTSGTTGLQNSHHDFNARTDIPYYHEDSEKTELLRVSDALKDHKAEIAAFFEAHEGRKERGDFIKGFFDNTYVEKILSNGQRAGYRAWDDVLNLWRGTYLSREKEEFLRWPHVADTIYGMILLHQWLDPDERPLPSEAEQVSLIEQAEAEKASAFILPQEAIDYVLCGRYSPSKLRIYDQYQKQESRQENAKFLKAEYGVGSYSNAIPSSGFRVDHDSTGITISRDYGDPDGKFLLTWAKVEKRIGELIAAGRYLNRAEKEHYPKYRAQVEQRKARWDIAAEICSIIDDYVDFKTRTGETDPYKELLLARTCANSFRIGEKKCYVLSGDNLFVLPTLRNAMQTIFRDKTHLTERCEAVLADLSGPLAIPLEPTEEELNPPPPPKKEYRLTLGDTVYLGAQEYELLAYNEQTVRLYDPTFPIFNKELPREEFDRLLAENPLNDRLLQVAENAAPVADAEEPDAGESPDAPLPVGRIDFLGTNGSVGESVEYTGAEEFVAAIKEENHAGAPMRIVLYRDGQGQTIPQDFLAELDPPPQGFQVIDMAQAQLGRAKWLINAYCMEVFEQEADFSDLSHVPLAFSSTSDSAHTVEISVDLVSFRLSYLVDGSEAASIQCAGFHDLNELLANLDFDEMVAFAEEEYNKQQTQKKQTEVQQTYVTENTFDSYLYQLVEGKQKFIGQIMTSKSPVRACEDIDETALSYAEIKALCTGNPHIKEKMDLDIDVQRLRLLKANHLSQRYALEDQIIKTLPQQIAKYEQSIEGYLSDMDRLKENTHPNEDGFSPMEVEGTVYTDKKAAGSAILAACKAMTSPEPVPLGQYRGFSMDLSFASLTREFKVTLKGALYYTTNLGTDVFGNILRLDNLLESMEERINTCREQLENTRMQLENAKLEVDKPFPQEDELKRKSARLDELNILLNMDKRESEIVDGDVGDEVTAPARGSPDRER